MKMEFNHLSSLVYVVCIFSQTVSGDRYTRLERRVDIIEQKVFFDAKTLREDIDDIFESLGKISEKSFQNSDTQNLETQKHGIKYDTTEIDRALQAVKRAMHVEKKNRKKFISEAHDEFENKYTQQVNLTSALGEHLSKMLKNFSSSLDIMRKELDSSKDEILESTKSVNKEEIEYIRSLQDDTITIVENLKTDNELLSSSMEGVSLNLKETKIQVGKIKEEIIAMNTEISETKNELEVIKALQEKAEQAGRASEREMEEKYDLLSQRIDCHNNFGYSLGHSCYYIESDIPLTWTQAVEQCRKNGRYLAEINSEEENAFFIKLASKLTPRDQIYGVWVGGSDRGHEGSWVWNDSQIPIHNYYSNFIAGLPDGGYGENCLHLIRKYNWNWNDYNCHNTLSYICEKSL